MKTKTRSPRFYINKKTIKSLKIIANYYNVSVSFLVELAIDYDKGLNYENKLKKKLYMLYQQKQNQAFRTTRKRKKYKQKQSITDIIREIYR